MGGQYNQTLVVLLELTRKQVYEWMMNLLAL
jgi:hypothetical protein